LETKTNKSSDNPTLKTAFKSHNWKLKLVTPFGVVVELIYLNPIIGN